MRLIYFFTVLFLIQFCLFAQANKYIAPKVLTKSQDILKADIQSHYQKKAGDSERTVVTSRLLKDGYVLESRLGQFWNGSDWDNSSKILFTYNPDGLKIEEIDQNWNNGQWENSYRFVTSYFLNDLVSLYEEQTWNGTDWQNSYQYISLYNDDNLLSEYDVVQWNGTGWDNAYKTTYSYYSSGNVEIIIDQFWNAGNWENGYKYSFQYNANDNVSERLTEQWIEGAWTNSIKDIYTYNPENLLALVASYWWPGSDWKESVEIYYDYDSYGNIIDMLTKFWESEILGLQNKYHTTYEYLPATNLTTKIENQEWNLQSEVWVNTSRDIKSYTAENNLETWLMEGWDGNAWAPWGKENYSYDENGNLDTLFTQNWSGTEWINSFRAFHTWIPVIPSGTADDASLPLEYSLEQNYPNPFNPSTRIVFNLAFNADVSLTVFDILGNEITRLIDGNLGAGRHEVNLNANQLTSGVYFYRLDAFDSEKNLSFSSVKKMMVLK